jgi:hypothetical protein
MSASRPQKGMMLMMDESTQISLSVLVTKEEYCEAAAMKKRKLRAHFAPMLIGAGVIFVLLGITGIFFGSSISLSIPAAACLVILGIALVCFDGLIAPILDKAAAAREFVEKEDLHFATTYVFKDDRVKIQNGRIQGDLPLSLLTRWSETSALFTMEIGRELSMAIPKRLLSTEECDLLRNRLETLAGGAKIK